MSIKEIANQLNILSKHYEIGKLQDIRKDLKGLKQRSYNAIFNINRISSDAEWAFHHGGRKEIQFNIGNEREGLRYGLAFSLETSKYLHDIDILFPKILRFNYLLREQPQLFSKFNMWSWNEKIKKRSEIHTVAEIKSDKMFNGSFIFFGKITTYENLDLNEILGTMDTLLPIYESIEREIHEPIKQKNNSFIFNSTPKKLVKNISYTQIEKSINIEVRHSLIQNKLIEELEKEYGMGKVAVEHLVNEKSKIDVVVEESNKCYIFYEIKTASSIRLCIREALGQLLEYSFWGGVKNIIVKALIIVGEYPMNEDADNYLKLLSNNFQLDIRYRQVKI